MKAKERKGLAERGRAYTQTNVYKNSNKYQNKTIITKMNNQTSKQRKKLFSCSVYISTNVCYIFFYIRHSRSS